MGIWSETGRSILTKNTSSAGIEMSRGSSQKKAAETNSEKWEKKVQDLQGKIKAKKAFFEDQNKRQL